MDIREYQNLFHKKFPYLQGTVRFAFRECAIAADGTFAFVTAPWFTKRQYSQWHNASYDENRRPKGVLTYDRNKEEGERWSAPVYLEWWNDFYLAPAQFPQPGFAGVCGTAVRGEPVRGRRNFLLRKGVPEEQEPILDEADSPPFLRGTMQNMKNVGGSVIAVGSNRSVASMEDNGVWRRLDIAGSGRDDLYLVGNRDFWHCDGAVWSEVDYPKEQMKRLWSICSDSDGRLYIMDKKGSVCIRDEKGQWGDVIPGFETSSDFGYEGIVCYDGRLWGSYDKGLWTCKDGKIERADAPEWVHACRCRLATDGRVLLTAGMGSDGGGGAAWLENGEWHKLVLFDEMEAAIPKKKAKK